MTPKTCLYKIPKPKINLVMTMLGAVTRYSSVVMLHFTTANLDVSRADLSGFCLVHFEELIHSRLCERFSCRLTPGLYNAAGLRAVTKGQVDKT